MNNKYQLVKVEFDQAQQPKFEEKRGKNYVEFGQKNDYSNYLIGLYGESPKHGAIIKGKLNYIFGKGFENLPKPANVEGESWNQVLKRSILDDELHGGYYLQIMWNLLGQIASAYHIEFQKVRVSKDLKTFYIKDDWSKSDFKEKAREYPAFDPNNRTGVQILFVKQYNPKSDVYPLPSYFQGLNYIESDVQVSRHILGNAKKNFVATKLINFNNGLPGEEEQEQVENDLKAKFSNHDGDRIVISFNPSKENAVDIVDLGQTNLTKEDFTNINNLIQQEIFACHQVTSPTLFGIKTEGQLGARNEIRDAYQIFQNTYVNERQQEHEKVFSKLINLSGVSGEWKIVPVEPLSFEFSESVLSANMTRNEIREKLGLKPDQVLADNTTVDQQQSVQAMQSNDAIKNLTGRQYQNVMRIVRQFGSGKINKQQASLMLKSGFGFSDEDVNTFLGIDDDPQTEFAAFAAEQDEKLLNEFASCGDKVDEFEVVSTHEAKDFHFFADAELDKLKANILDLISKDKKITPEVIATVLDKSVDTINTAISTLQAEGLLKITGTELSILDAKYKPLVSKLVKPLAKIPGSDKATTTEVLLRYAYAGPEDDRNRPFCARMLELSKTKLWSRSDIERISQRLGYSVWDRRGGWFMEPDGTARPYCRHRWDVKVVTRKK